MKSLSLFILIFSTFQLVSATVQNSFSTSTPPIMPDRVIVKLNSFELNKRALGAESTLSILQKTYGLTSAQSVFPLAIRSKYPSMNFIYEVTFSDKEPTSIARDLEKEPTVLYAEPRYLRNIRAIPNDTLFSRQDYLQFINVLPAWDAIRAEQGDVVIAIVDGGTDINHVDLEPVLWQNPNEIAGNGIDDDGNGFVDDIVGWNFPLDNNDPSGLVTQPGNSEHGTHVAGIAAATTNNTAGVAGISWNARLMAINAASATRDNAIAYGYEGILYAAINGAKIISCSWGALGGRSDFEQEVIATATDLGAVVVAASGNDNSEAFHYPSSYENVFSVAAVGNNGSKASYSNFGYTIDIAAPGNSIYNTIPNDEYGYISGTSMATPVISGALALIATQRPDWSGIKVAEQLRVTANTIDNQNPSYQFKLGKGMLDVNRAITETLPSLRISNVEFVDNDGSGIIDPGELIQVSISLTNHLASASNISLTLSSQSPYVTITQANAQVTAINETETITVQTPFTFTTSDTTASGTPIDFILQMSAGDYQDFDTFMLTVSPLFGVISINNIETSVTPIGRIGYADVDNQDEGNGFKFAQGPNLLFEGAVICGVGPDQISNAARGNVTGQLIYDRDFSTTKNGNLQVFTPGSLTDQETIAIFDDSQSANPMNVQIVQETFANNDSLSQDFIIFRYTIENKGQNELNNFHFGLFFDWDMDGGTFDTNIADFDATNNIAYVYDVSDIGPDTFVGIAAMTEKSVFSRAIYNDESLSSNPSWGIYDGFSDQEKWEAISTRNLLSAGPADISHAIAAGPFDIAVNEKIQPVFVLMAGQSLEDLQTKAHAAKDLYMELFETSVQSPTGNQTMPQKLTLYPNYPNPFNPTTEIQYHLPGTTDVQLSIYNLLGQKVITLVDQNQVRGTYAVTWDGMDSNGNQAASGLYFMELATHHHTLRRKMMLTR
jgi:subtilisin family serine protease